MVPCQFSTMLPETRSYPIVCWNPASMNRHDGTKLKHNTCHQNYILLVKALKASCCPNRKHWHPFYQRFPPCGGHSLEGWYLWPADSWSDSVQLPNQAEPRHCA